MLAFPLASALARAWFAEESKVVCVVWLLLVCVVWLLLADSQRQMQTLEMCEGEEKILGELRLVIGLLRG